MVRNVTDQSLTFPHIFELLRRLLTLAGNRRLSIVVFVEDFGMEVANLPPDLRNHEEFALCSTQDNPAAKARFLAKIASSPSRNWLDGLVSASA
jgi:hypothetical protein